MNLYESSEDYLERILMLQKKLGQVRSIDISQDMDFSKPSVSVAMKKLKDNGYIKIDDLGYIFLTDEGRKVATRMLERHEVLSSLLISLGVNKEQAVIDACKIEHGLSDESFDAIKKHIKAHIK